MSLQATIVYLHGFGSGPGSRKAQFLRETFTHSRVLVPELDGGDFCHLRLGACLRRAREALLAIPSQTPLMVVGSSLGGYVAQAICRGRLACSLVLLAPALNLQALIPALSSAAQRRAWRAQGALPVWHSASQQLLPLHAAFLQDLERARLWPLPRCRGTVLHGRRDAVVPFQHSVRAVTQAPGWSLHLLDAEHGLDDAHSLGQLRWVLQQAGFA